LGGFAPPYFVIPAKAGIQTDNLRGWIPVFTGMTVELGVFKGGEAPLKKTFVGGLVWDAKLGGGGKR
jgi:hypothetical protein